MEKKRATIKKKGKPDLKKVKVLKAGGGTTHSVYGLLEEGKELMIDPAHFGAQIFEPVGWTPGEQKKDTAVSSSADDKNTKKEAKK